jgi:hypothetical protein
MRDIGFIDALPVLSYTASVNGAAVDLSAAVSGKHKPFIGAGPGGRQFKAILVAEWTSGTGDFKFQYSADGSTGWTDITGAAFAQVTADAVEEIHFVAPERYIRVVGTLATTPSMLAAIIVLGHERYD